MMRIRILVAVSLFMAGLAPSTRAQALTADSLQAILRRAAVVARQIDSSNQADSALQRQARELVADYAEHNKEPCEYPEGKPELCADFDAVRSRLIARSADLQKALRVADEPRRPLRLQFEVLMKPLRDATWAPAIASKKEAIVACSNLDPVKAAAACLVPFRRAGPGRSSP